MTLGDARRELAAFRISERNLRDRIECLEIPWTWNIASPGAERSTLRLLPADVRELRRCLEQGETPGANPRREFSEVSALVLPGFGHAALSGSEVAGVLSCGLMHVSHLLAAGALTRCAGTRPQPGRTHGSRIPRASLEAFLQARVLNSRLPSCAD